MALQLPRCKVTLARSSVSSKLSQPRPVTHLPASRSDVAAIAVSVLAASTLAFAPASFAADEVDRRSQAAESKPSEISNSSVASNTGPSSISFTVVSKKVRDALNQRDENMAWKCKGVNMYDCDGTDAAEAEKRWEEFRNTFKSGK